MKENKGLKIFLTVLSILFSIGGAFVFFYLGYLGIPWFFPIAAFFMLDGFMTFIGSNIKDQYKGMRVLGVWQIIHVILLMVYLLVMILWNDINQIMPYQLSYIAFGSLIGYKLITCLINEIAIKKQYNPTLHAFRNSDAIIIFYLLLILGLTITNQFYPGTGEGLLKEKPIWIYIIDIVLNAGLTIWAALLALSTDIRAKEREHLSTTGKIRHLIRWIGENEIGVFFGLIFTGYLAALAFMNSKTSIFYVLIGVYYVLMGTVRFLNYFWHRRILKDSANHIEENRRSSWILLFNAIVYTLFSDIVAFGAIFLMTNKINAGTNIYYFLFFIVPFGIFKLIIAAKSIRSNRRENNTYKMGIGYVSLISAFFSFLEGSAIAVHSLHTGFKWAAVITSVVFIKIFVLVIAVTFVVHWIRSLIINRKGKERRYAKDKH